jgi:DNA polymerase-3 subunit gamma/tau
MAQALYRQWRPLTWSEVVGQEHVVRTLQNAVQGERLSHAYLFSGPRGTGKTSTARILAKAVNCLDQSLEKRPCNECKACVAVNEGRYLDLIEIDAASNTSVDDIRDLRDRINFAPNEGRFKVYIVDEVHMLSTAAFNALLKTLEEPPSHAMFILATTEVHKIPATVLSRCQRHEFRRIPIDVISGYLDEKIQEGDYEVEPDATQLIARQATGSLRDATSLLDQLLSMGEVVTLERAQEVLGTALDETVGDLVSAIANGEIGTGLEIINQALDGGIDPRQFARQTVEWLRVLLLITAGEKIDLQSELMVAQAELLGTDGILAAMHAFSQATRGERTAWQPGLALELAFMDAGPKSQSEEREIDPEPVAKAQGEPGSRSEAVIATIEPEGTSVMGPSEGLGGGSEIEDTPAEDSVPVEAQPVVKGEPPSHEPEAAEDDGPQIARDSTENRYESPSGSEFQKVLDAWPELLSAAYDRDPRTQALLNSCKPLAVDDKSLVLGFKSDLLREKMEKGHNQEIVSESLSAVLDTELGVRCVLLQDWGSDQSAVPLPEGGMVAAALRDLGAEVTDYGPESKTAGTAPNWEERAEDGKEEEER